MLVDALFALGVVALFAVLLALIACRHKKPEPRQLQQQATKHTAKNHSLSLLFLFKI